MFDATWPRRSSLPLARSQISDSSLVLFFYSGFFMLRSRSTCGATSHRILYFVAPNSARCLWRANSTLVRQEKPRRPPPLRISNQSVLVKTWSFAESMADAFAIIRALEDKYGPLREYHFTRVSPATHRCMQENRNLITMTG